MPIPIPVMPQELHAVRFVKMVRRVARPVQIILARLRHVSMVPGTPRSAVPTVIRAAVQPLVVRYARMGRPNVRIPVISERFKPVPMAPGEPLPIVPIIIRAAVHPLAVRFARIQRRVVPPVQIISER